MRTAALFSDIVLFSGNPPVPPGKIVRAEPARKQRDEVQYGPRDVLERELVASIRMGDAVAFRALFDDYADRLTQFATILLHDRPAAQDVVADVFFALWRAREGWQPDHVSVYLFGAVRNRCYNHRASLLVRRETSLEDLVAASASPSSAGAPLDDVTAQLDAEALMQRIQTILQTLPSQRRAVALLRWQEEMTFAEIAAALQISENAARLHVSRAVKAIRQVMPGVGEAGE